MAEEKSYRPRLPGLDWEKRVRDPIWGEIGITKVESKIVQTEAFTRLRGIKQLSFAYLSFPGAVHSRFEHSIGVMHATDQILKSVKDIAELKMESKDRQLLRLAALLHDIGHPPFSHAMENLFSYHPEIWSEIKEDLPANFKKFMASRGKDYGKPRKHEDFSDYIICTDLKIKKIIREWLLETDKNAIKMNEGQIETLIRDVIAKLAVGEEVTTEEVSESFKDLSKIFKGIMSGDIDADKIDYLARDNYYCGLPYNLDVNSLRDQVMINKNRELTLRPEAIKFVNTVILARYFLIIEVHQDKWDAFTTAKVVELLNGMLKSDPARASTIFNMFTKWEDAGLIEYLKKSGDKEIKEILSTEYSLQEIGKLDYWDTHPYVREAIQIISENEHYIPKMQEDLREITGQKNLFIHINRVKSPSFDMKVEGGNLLRNEILRGISEESLKNLQIVVYGNSRLTNSQQALKKLGEKIEHLPEQTEQIDSYVKNIEKDLLKKLLAYLAVRHYRQICGDCARDRKILAPDFLLLIMDAISKICVEMKERHDPGDPTRQSIYRIACLVHQDLKSQNVGIHGKVDLNEKEITPSFYREIRKYEQLGLISYARKIELLENEDVMEDDEEKHLVFRFDRRFKLNTYGVEKLEKMHDLQDAVPEYSEYIKLWDMVDTSVKKHRPEIENILIKNNHPENGNH